MSIEEFVKQYGTKTLGLMVGEFIKRAPSFPGDKDLAREVGLAMGDLESALEGVYIRTNPASAKYFYPEPGEADAAGLPRP